VKFLQSNRRTLIALLIFYSIGVGIAYSFPVGLTDSEWYGFYSYLDTHGATPFVDIREGYPPIGFLVYMPLYAAFRGNVTIFAYSFRVINGALLVATLYSLYLVTKEVVGERKGLKTAFYYAVIPSVAIANAYSNDVVALLPAVLAIYMMQKKKPALCGILLGVATLSKGFPALLLIPALIAFKDNRDKIKVIGIMLFTLILVSLPFMLANPFTYISTFTNQGSRGPWETVWALVEGYNSHGGFLHPFFDKFFYHFNLLKIYPASPYDHAIYDWKFNLMPNLLTLGQLGMVAVFAFAYKGRKEPVQLSGLLYISYIFLFQGYSTQFAVSTPLYLLLATINNQLVFLIPLEVSHLTQMIAWNSQTFGPELLRNAHLPMLVFAIILRTVVFGALIVSSLRSRLSLKLAINVLKRSFGYLKLFKDKWLVLIVSATVVMALMSSVVLYAYLNDNSKFNSFDGHLIVNKSNWQNIDLDELEKGDQVMVRLVTNTWIDAELDDPTVKIERGVRNQFNLKGSFNETYLFFIADSESHNLMLKMRHSKIPFRITDGLHEDLSFNMTSSGSALVLNLRDSGLDGQGSVLRMAYPCYSFLGDDFRLDLKYNVTEGEVSNVLLDLFDDTDEWLYTFTASEDFVLKPDTLDLHGKAYLVNDDISLVAILIFLEDGSSATFRLEELNLSNGESCDVDFYAEDEEEIFYQVFIERDFQPSLSYAAALILTVVLCGVAIFLLYRRVW
jgi:hypothetical protein